MCLSPTDAGGESVRRYLLSGWWSCCWKGKHLLSMASSNGARKHLQTSSFADDILLFYAFTADNMLIISTHRVQTYFLQDQAVLYRSPHHSCPLIYPQSL